MGFTFETLYDVRALTSVARAIRKLLRKNSGIFVRLFGLAVVVFGVYRSSPLSGKSFSFSVGGILGYVALLMILVVVFFEDTVNGVLARSRLPRGEYIIDAQFEDELFSVRSMTGVNSWQYQRIETLAETRYYYIFIFSEHHAEVFEKDSLAGITQGEFRQFMFEKTGKRFQKV